MKDRGRTQGWMSQPLVTMEEEGPLSLLVRGGGMVRYDLNRSAGLLQTEISKCIFWDLCAETSLARRLALFQAWSWSMVGLESQGAQLISEK